ncbi:MAG TPA: hypothetical protein P5513_05390 [Candidatus Diapherotrites archaeon]|nr:hypothetical protein [Candidatus Diapherotrites archaeon]
MVKFGNVEVLRNATPIKGLNSFEGILEGAEKLGHKRRRIEQDKKFEFIYKPSEFSDIVLQADGEEYLPTELFINSTCKHFGIPIGYAKKISTGLLLDNLNKRRIAISEFDLIYRNNEAIAVVRPSYEPFNLVNLFNTIKEYSQSCEIKQSTLDDNGIYIELLSRDKHIEIAGEAFDFGVSISSSDTARFASSLLPYINRRICANGAIAPFIFGGYRKTRGFDEDTVINKFKNLLTGEGLQQNLARMLSMPLLCLDIYSIYSKIKSKFGPDVSSKILSLSEERLTWVLKRVHEYLQPKEEFPMQELSRKTLFDNLSEFGRDLTNTENKRYIQVLCGDLLKPSLS